MLGLLGGQAGFGVGQALPGFGQLLPGVVQAGADPVRLGAHAAQLAGDGVHLALGRVLGLLAVLQRLLGVVVLLLRLVHVLLQRVLPVVGLRRRGQGCQHGSGQRQRRQPPHCLLFHPPFPPAAARGGLFFDTIYPTKWLYPFCIAAGNKSTRLLHPGGAGFGSLHSTVFFSYKRVATPRAREYTGVENEVNKLEGFKQTLLEAMQNETAFTIPVFGGIPVAGSVVVSWIIMAVWMIATLLATRNLRVRNPGKVQVVLETGVSFLNGFVRDTIGPHWRPFAPYLGTVALYIGFANIIGLFGLTSPTKDVSVTAALAVMSMLLIYGAQFRYNGLAGGLKRFGQPSPVMVPINLMEIIIRPLALCMRLFGNVLGAYIIMEIIKYLVPAVVPAVFSIYFDLFDGIIQTVVFVFLTAMFAGEGIKDEE